jgi:hypothetical protein
LLSIERVGGAKTIGFSVWILFTMTYSLLGKVILLYLIDNEIIISLSLSLFLFELTMLYFRYFILAHIFSSRLKHEKPMEII